MERVRVIGEKADRRLPMKLIKYLTVIACALAMVAGSTMADDAKKPAEAPCCAKAKAKGEECKHECCVAAKKEGKVCEKCSKPKKEKKDS